MTPEPRPDEPTPQDPRPKRAVSNRAILGGLFLVITITAALFLFLTITRNRSVAKLAEASSNLRSLSCNLHAFDEEYGSFPDASTAVDVKDSTGTPVTLGDSSSNQLFRQLIATVGKSEKIFWADTTRGPGKLGDIIEPDGRVLVNGRDLFDPAQHYWRGISPDLKWPE